MVTPSKLNWLRVALWSGAFFGLLEAPLLIFFLSISPIDSSLGQFWVDWNLVWIAPLADSLLFVSIGAGWMLLSWLARRPAPNRAILCLYFFLIAFGLLILPIRLNRWAALVFALGLTRMFWSSLPRWEARMMRFIQVSLVPLWAVWMLAAFAVIGSDYYRSREDLRQPPSVPAGGNVLLIVVDTLRADRTSLYGNARETTPTLAELASRSLVFDQAISTSSWTLPAHASLFTGLYPYQHNAGNLKLDGRAPTLAERLQARGYRTGGFVGNTLFANRNTGLARGFQQYDDIFASPLDAFTRTVYGRRIVARLAPAIGYYDWPARKSAADVNKQFLDWLDRGPQRPFFAFLNYIDLHGPYFPPPNASVFFGTARDAMSRKPLDQDSYHASEASPNQMTMERDAYDSVLHYVDGNIRGVLDELEKRGLLSNTLVIITSDHGEAHFEHGLFGHTTSLYREELHIPLILSYGRRFSPGTRSDRVVDLSDLPATILSLLELPVTLPGRVITRPAEHSADASSEAFSELEANPGHGPNAPNRKGWLKSLVTRRWHFIQHQDGSVQLFDWMADPGELKNLAQAPEYQMVVASFRKLIAARMPGSAGNAQAKPPEPTAGATGN